MEFHGGLTNLTSLTLTGIQAGIVFNVAEELPCLLVGDVSKFRQQVFR